MTEGSSCHGCVENCVAKPSNRCKINRVLVVLVAIVYALQLILYYYTSPIILTENSKRRDVELGFYMGIQYRANNTPASPRKSRYSNAINTTQEYPSHSQNLLLLPPPLRELSSQSVPRNCSDYWCTSLLDRSALLNFQLCTSFYKEEHHKDPQKVVPKRCKFRNSQGHTPVALVSVPGSGNTWLRGLLEMATGICTGSIYCDVPLTAGGFMGELIHDGSVLVIKTHTSDAQWRGVQPKKRNIEDAYYTSAVVLIRNPFDTFVCERHRFLLKEKAEENVKQNLHATDLSHVAEVGLEKFTNQSDWNSFVQNMTIRWGKTLLEWVTPEHHVLAIRYEDVKAKPLDVLEKILIFLKFPEHLTDWKTRVKNGFNDFKRHHKTTQDTRKYYSFSQVLAINRMISSTEAVLKKRGINLKLKDYVIA